MSLPAIGADEAARRLQKMLSDYESVIESHRKASQRRAPADREMQARHEAPRSTGSGGMSAAEKRIHAMLGEALQHGMQVAEDYSRHAAGLEAVARSALVLVCQLLADPTETQETHP